MNAAPETPRQVRTWQAFKNAYLSRGLCSRCAAQAAFGHQNGFTAGPGRTAVRPPCDSCTPIVATFPIAVAEGSQWRKIGGLSRAGTPTPGTTENGTEYALTALHGAPWRVAA
jgi:hypothetical protein